MYIHSVYKTLLKYGKHLAHPFFIRPIDYVSALFEFVNK